MSSRRSAPPRWIPRSSSPGTAKTSSSATRSSGTDSSRALIHWTVALTFFVCLLTGMPIWTPVFGWMAHLFGGLSVCRVIHPWAGVAFFVASIVHVLRVDFRHARRALGEETGSDRA